MSRIISGKVRLDVQQVDLAAAVETVRPAAAAKGLQLQAILGPLALPVSGDPSRLQQPAELLAMVASLAGRTAAQS
jgi:signal transduction histidine kinase